MSLGSTTLTSPWPDTLGWQLLPSLGTLDEVDGRRWRPALREDVNALAVLFPVPSCWQRLSFSWILGSLLVSGWGLQWVDCDEVDALSDSVLSRDPP